MNCAAYASETNEIRDFLNKSIENEVIYLLQCVYLLNLNVLITFYGN